MKILVFKTDRAGDFLNITGILKEIFKDKNEVDIICSKYNYSIVKYYNNFKKIYFKENFFKFFFKNNSLLFKKYDVIYQFDGSSWSFNVCFLLNSSNKYSLKYIKYKKFIFWRFAINRPNLFLNFFFKTVECYEDYKLKNNFDYNYLNLYKKLVINSGIKLKETKHYFPSMNIKENINCKIYSNYILLHLDERWKWHKDEYLNIVIKNIQELSRLHKIIVTSDLNNTYLDRFNSKNKSITVIPNTSVDDLIYLVKKCDTLISMHSGLLIHLALCFDKKIIDILSINKFREIDRWVPINKKYKRLRLENIKDQNIFDLLDE